MHKVNYEIRINRGTPTRKPFVYSYGPTKDITIHMRQGAVCIRFAQNTGRTSSPLRSSNDKLCTDAVKKAMLLHLMVYGKPLRISEADLSSNGIVCETYSKNIGHPLVYSMIEGNLDYPLPQSWKTAYPLILQTPKSAYDGRMNAVVALLLAKTQYYRSEKSLYLWMAMNGFYNFLTAEYAKLPDGRQYRREGKQHEYLCKVIGHTYFVEGLADKEKEALFTKGLALLKRQSLPLDVAYASLMKEDSTFYQSINNLIMTGGKDGVSLHMTPYTFMIIWLPYQIRCHYFHSNQAMPLFLYSDEPLLTALSYTNYFLEQFLEEQLPNWMQSKELSEQKKSILSEAGRLP